MGGYMRSQLATLTCAALCLRAALAETRVYDAADHETPSGVHVLSGGDGVNHAATVAGRTARRIAPDSMYLYGRVEDPGWEGSAPRDLYVTVTVADDEFNRVQLQYDRAAASPNIGTMYTYADGTAVLLASGGWRDLHFHLPQARLGHGQNHGADFRLCARALAVTRIAVSTEKPAGFIREAGIDAASLAALRVDRAPGMELTFGNDAGAADAAIYRALSVTSVESYVDWAGVEPDARNEWDWSKWDRQVATLQAHGLKWVPFLIAGPAYATPLWFHGGEHSHYFRCLEHDTDSKVQSIFNPALPPYVDRFLEAFAARYRDTGVIESVLLGVTGIYGESIYPAGPQDGWTARLTGPYHNHTGWWAGDRHARRHFARAMRTRYRTIRRLNRAWGTDLADFDAVAPFLPEDAPGDRAKADCAEWYQKAMEDWSVLWVEATRRHFPDTEIYLCTGGHGVPVLGADFTAQAKAIEPFGAGIRITNEASDYASNFVVTREVATATRLYRTFAGFEPAGRVDPVGVVARIYNATASGVRQLHYYSPNVLQSKAALESFRANAADLVPRRPEVRAAFYVSRETWAVDPGGNGRMYAHARLFRDLIDYDMVTRQSVVDGGLDGCRFLFLVESAVMEPRAAKAIRNWVRGGGILVTATRSGETVAGRLYDLADWRRELLAPFPTPAQLIERRLDAPPPVAWTLHVGTADDEPWLTGDWFHRERGLEWGDDPEAEKRWSGARAGVRLPTRPGRDYDLVLEAHLAGASLGGDPNAVSVNGTVVGALDRAGTQSYRFVVPASALGSEALAHLEIRMTTWVPAEHQDSTDDRALGVALHRVTWREKGSTIAPTAAAVETEMNAALFAPLARRIGRGWSVHLPGAADDPDRLAEILGLLLRDTGSYLPGERPVFPDDGRRDGVYTTLLPDAVLTYDAQAARIGKGGMASK